jgi:hypothetical protein
LANPGQSELAITFRQGWAPGRVERTRQPSCNQSRCPREEHVSRRSCKGNRRNGACLEKHTDKCPAACDGECYCVGSILLAIRSMSSFGGPSIASGWPPSPTGGSAIGTKLSNRCRSRQNDPGAPALERAIAPRVSESMRDEGGGSHRGDRPKENPPVTTPIRYHVLGPFALIHIWLSMCGGAWRVAKILPRLLGCLVWPTG